MKGLIHSFSRFLAHVLPKWYKWTVITFAKPTQVILYMHCIYSWEKPMDVLFELPKCSHSIFQVRNNFFLVFKILYKHSMHFYHQWNIILQILENRRAGRINLFDTSVIIQHPIILSPKPVRLPVHPSSSLSVCLSVCNTKPVHTTPITFHQYQERQCTYRITHTHTHTHT